MAGIFDYVPVIALVLFALGLVGTMVYERARTREEEEKAAPDK